MQGAKICVIDDNTSVLASLKTLLASDDLDAETFDNPETFLEYVRANTVPLAILDLWMPAQSGIEIQQRLHHLSPGTRVIIITGRPEAATRTRALNRGAFAFLAKPLDDEAFLASVRDALAE
jgi:FixJ family two-component response regulator